MPTVEPASQAEIITERLAELELSVSQFARELGVRPSFVHAVRTGKRRITKPVTVEKAAHILGIPANELYISARHLPPDCWEIVRHRPEMLRAIRALDAKIDAREAQSAN